jgi:hypothetical protein
MDGPAVVTPAPPPLAPGYQAFDMPISRSGYAVDKRGFTALFMAQAADNTNYLIERGGLKPVCRFDHPDLCDPQGEAPTGGGVLMRLWTQPDPTQPEDVILWATVALWGTLLESQLAGTSPQRSIGWSLEGMGPGGQLVGHYVDHLAFLPSKAAAFPGLDQQADRALNAAGNPPKHWLMKAIDTIGKLVRRAETLTARPRTLAANPSGDRSDPEELGMTPEECKMLTDMAASLSALAGKYAEDAPPEEDKPSEDAPPEGEAGAAGAEHPKAQGASTGLRAERDVMFRHLSDEKFAALVSDGFAKPDQRKQFEAMAQGHGGGLSGLRKADDFFRSLGAVKAPAGQLPPGTTNASDALAAERKSRLDEYWPGVFGQGSN